jgi:NhaP-type Na+/H+ or K+/H+ antiporter
MEEGKHKAFEAAVILVVVAVAGRMAWALLEPAVPVLLVLVGLVVVYGFIFRRRH